MGPRVYPWGSIVGKITMPKGKESEVQTSAQTTAICQTCIHVSECAHYQQCQRLGQSIQHCENFDDKPVLSMVGETAIPREGRAPESPEPGVVFVSGRMKGLCINCDRRTSCGYPIRDGGVWHCEDYC
jgi:hypothetical protein